MLRLACMKDHIWCNSCTCRLTVLVVHNCQGQSGRAYCAQHKLGGWLGEGTVQSEKTMVLSSSGRVTAQSAVRLQRLHRTAQDCTQHKLDLTSKCSCKALRMGKNVLGQHLWGYFNQRFFPQVCLQVSELCACPLQGCQRGPGQRRQGSG